VHPAGAPRPGADDVEREQPNGRVDAHDEPAAAKRDGVSWAPLSHFEHRPDNPRWDREYDPSQDPELEKFGDTVDTFGILQAVTVTSVDTWLTYHPEHSDRLGPESRLVVVMGNRRLAIARHKHLEGLPYLLNERLARPNAFRMAPVIENYHRKGVDPIREAHELVAELAATQESKRALSERIGISHTQINQRIQLLDLIPEFQALVSDEVVSVQKALPIARLSPQEQRQLLELGPPYQRSGHAGAAAEENDDPGKSLSTAKPVTIKRRSTPAQVAETLRAQLAPEILEEVLHLLRS
jgi:ParB family chromosome partitioning protein